MTATRQVIRNGQVLDPERRTAEAADIVRGAHGASGPNVDYVVNTVAHLKGLGIRDHGLEDVVKRLG